MSTANSEYELFVRMFKLPILKENQRERIRDIQRENDEIEKRIRDIKKEQKRSKNTTNPKSIQPIQPTNQFNDLIKLNLGNYYGLSQTQGDFRQTLYICLIPMNLFWSN
ncbi:hypothetical protein ACTFIU_004120 [Dictyostelium citrinum]